MRAALWAGILIGEVRQVHFFGFAEDVLKCFGLVGTCRKVLITIDNGTFVPSADTGGVGFAEVEVAQRIEGDVGVRVVHDRSAVVDAGDVVVHEADGVAYLVRRELTEAGQRHLQHARIGLRTFFIRFDEALRDEKILAHPQRTEQNMAFDDFAGAGVGNGAAVRPAARGAVYPVDDIVAHVEGVGVGGQFFHLKGIFIPCRLKSLIPPGGAFHEGRFDGFGRAAVQIIYDGFYCLADFGVRVFLF